MKILNTVINRIISCCVLKTLIFTTIAFLGRVDADENSRQGYLELVQKYPRVVSPLGKASNGEIQIIVDPQEMAAIEASMGRTVGVISQDKYFLWVNDACIFPNGTKGIYGRVMWRSSLQYDPGVAVMAVLPNGKIILNCNFRHATRSWEIELPRGCVNPGESAEEAAKRETLEETGMVVKNLSLLGSMPPDTGLTNSVVPIFMAQVFGVEDTQKEDAEAIEEILTLTLEEIKQAFLQGYLECSIRGKQTQVFFRDPFLAYAILMYGLRLETS